MSKCPRGYDPCRQIGCDCYKKKATKCHPFHFNVEWDFEDYKGWSVWIGAREEGQITWRAPNNNLVQEGDADPGYSWHGYAPNHKESGDGFESFDDAVANMFKTLFPEVNR